MFVDSERAWMPRAEWDAVQAELAALRARVAALEDGIRTYGGHFDYCNATRGFTDPKCNCGLRELLKPQPVPRQEPVR